MANSTDEEQCLKFVTRTAGAIQKNDALRTVVQSWGSFEDTRKRRIRRKSFAIIGKLQLSEKCLEVASNSSSRLNGLSGRKLRCQQRRK